jgi:uncharacterized protein (DUF2147 family)
MKNLFLSMLFSALSVCAFANPDAVIGVWKTGDGKALVKVYKEGEKYFGKIVWLAEPNDPKNGQAKLDVNNPDEKMRSRPVMGLVNLRDFTFDGENEWDNGNIYDPKTGNDYSCTINLKDNNTLEVRGYVGISLFGRTDTWTRMVKK